MPAAALSSPIRPAHNAGFDQDAPADRAGGSGLTARFRAICDKRATYNTLHSLETILAVAAFGTATVAGDTVTGISHWAQDAPQEILQRLGCRRDPFTGLYYPPSERTLRRVLAQTDGNDLDRHTSAYLAQADDVRDLPGDAADERETPAQIRIGQGREREARRAGHRERERPRPQGMLQAGAADGKVIRGARQDHTPAPQLLSLFHHTRGVVLGQRQIADKTSEVPELAPLLAGAAAHSGAPVAVITMDALHTVRESARHISEDLGRYYVMFLKGNQPTVLAAAQKLLSGPDTQFAATTHTMTDRGHGRTETRTIRTTPATGIDFPAATQVFRVLRYSGGLDGVRTHKEHLFAITNLPAPLAGPAHLNHYVREHWSVENSEHYVRDRTFHEDDCRARTGQLPHVLATLRNLAIGAFRQHGHVNLAHARRHYTNIPHRLLDLFTL